MILDDIGGGNIATISVSVGMDVVNFAVTLATQAPGRSSTHEVGSWETLTDPCRRYRHPSRYVDGPQESRTLVGLELLVVVKIVVRIVVETVVIVVISIHEPVLRALP